MKLVFVHAAALLGLVALAGCGGTPDADAHANTEMATISFTGLGNAGAAGDAAQVVAVSVPGFSAKLNVPGINLGGPDTDIDGIRLHPGSRTTAMKITGPAGDGSGGEGHGTVEMGFIDPTSPADLLAYYQNAAKTAGWREIPPAAGQQFAATKAGDRGTQTLAMRIGAQGTGSTGRLTVTGS